MYYLRTRFYDPITCRFLTADSIEYLDPETVGGLNLYAYCGNNPANRFDENGNWSMPTWAKIVIGVAATAAAAIITVATGGAAAPVLIGVAASTLGGAAVSAIEHRVSTGSWDGAGEAALTGAADGFMLGGLGALGGAIIGGVINSTMIHSSAIAGKPFNPNQTIQIGVDVIIK